MTRQRPINFLLVDHDASVCLILSTLLRRLGHHVEIACDGKEAIELFTDKPRWFQIVITDNRMPLVSGLNLVQHLRRNEFGGIILVVSGFWAGGLLNASRVKQVD